MPSGLLQEKRRNHEQGVESPHTDVSRLIGQCIARHIRVADLDDDKNDSERNDS